MNISKIGDLFLRCGLSKDEYTRIYPLIWKRNKRILKITSLLSTSMGGLFLLYALITRAVTWLPYLILLCGSAAILIINKITDKSKSLTLNIVLCYSQMVLTCFYAGFLSIQISNYALPATSIVVFISLLPLSIDDNLVRMFCFMLCESAAYLVLSYFKKSASAFSLDVMNLATFCAVGMILYAVVCTRNIREIYQGIHIDRIQKSVISSIASVVEERDESTGGHIVRTEELVRALTEKMRKDAAYSDRGERYYDNIILAAPMHDIGKIRIPDTILNKPGSLTPEEFEIMKKHSEYGADIIQKTMRGVEKDDYYEVAENIAKYHHERYDGKGYPCGLSGEDIPLEARVMALTDVYDALVSERVYKKPYTKEKARKIIEENAGTQFDPKLTVLFLECIE